MRHPRLRRDGNDTFYHCYNRVAGNSGDRSFGRTEKEAFVQLLKKLVGYYVVEVVAYQVMSNHFHLILYAPCERPSPEETCRRYEDYYGGKRRLTTNTERCEEIAAKLRDVSEFMGDLQQQFTTWLDHTRPVRRRGALWAGRYKNTVLEVGLAVWNCWKYVEMNPVRAGIVADPAEYRFCSFAEWSAGCQHPFADTVQRRLMPVLEGLLHAESQGDLHRAMRMEFARIAAVEARRSLSEEEAAVEQAGKTIPFRRRVDRHLRDWVDGAVIGTELFVMEVMSRARPGLDMKKRRLSRAVDMAHSAAQLCCGKQLRVITC